MIRIGYWILQDTSVEELSDIIIQFDLIIIIAASMNKYISTSANYKRITDVLWQTKVSVTPPSSGYPTGDTSLEATHPRH